MSFVGKLLVVLQVVLSVCFMTFAGAVYTTHNNWKKAYTNTSSDLEQRQRQLSTTEELMEKERTDHKMEMDALTKARDSLTAEVTSLRADNEQHLARLDDHERQMTVAQEQARVALEHSQHRNNEALELRAQIKTITESRHEELQKRMGLETALKVEEEKVAMLTERLKTELRDVAQYKKQLRNLGVSDDPAIIKAQAEQPQAVDGEVQQVTMTPRGSVDLVKISIGSDDGLIEGHKLTVYRGDKYLGELQVVRTSPDIAVARVIKPTKTGIIKEGDIVTTKL